MSKSRKNKVLTQNVATEIETANVAIANQIDTMIADQNDAVDEVGAENEAMVASDNIADLQIDEALDSYDDPTAADPISAIDDKDIDAALAKIEAIEAQNVGEEVSEEPAAEHDETDASDDYAAVLASFDDDTVDKMVFKIKEAVDDREKFEMEKSSLTGKTNIQSTLKKVRNSLVSKRAARVFLASNVNPSFINRTVHDGARYNVYALGKIADIVSGLTGAQITNAINLACMKSLFQFKRAGAPFSFEMAKAACSKNIIVDSAVRTHLVRHTVSPSTAPTQASSTMQALTTLGVVDETGLKKNPTYALTGHPIVAHLEDMLLGEAEAA